MKIYEAKTLTAATKSRAKQYEELKKEVAALKKEFQGIVSLDNEFQGAGATAIKSFYEAQIEVADAWMELFTTQISFLEGIPASLEEADLSGNTVVEVPFLDGEVSTGINQAKSLVDEQASDLQRILNSIDDILPLDMFNQKDFNEKITLAGQRLDDTVTKVENVDRQLVEEYDVSVGQENVAVGLFRALLDATKQDGNVSPMTFNQSAFKNSDVYQVKDEVAGQMKDYQTFKKQQAEAQKIEHEMEELENRPWYEKAWDTTKTFTGEFTGYYDSIRASTGVDPVTGRKLSDAERIAAGAMAAAGFIPVVGWAGRAIKGGSALYKTAKGLNAANHALDAYKTTKGFSLLQKTEYGIYGLLAANGLGEAVTGKDMFGNQLTEEQRQNGLLMALGIGGVAGAAKVADKVASGTKFVPYSKEFAQKQVQKAKAFGRQIGNVEVPLRIRVEELATAYGNNYKHVTFDKTTIKDIVQKFAVKRLSTVNQAKADDAMVEAVRNLPAYTRRPNQPRNYKYKERNEDGTTLYTFISNKNGKEYQVIYDKDGYPIFQSKFEIYLPEKYFLETDAAQFEYLSKTLSEEIISNPELAEKFTAKEYEVLKEGRVPKTLTWHHHQETGRMQIVDYFEHQAAGHTGGRAIWGGGESGRKGIIKKEILEMVTWD
ncbi:T7SS effector LXG polymorphic toxin [Peribacillus sp. ACCC06369]|uniref:T7SS effector LXG polymorphic toxin n=1 Tax=Peribacillus sp. ACCC06369 TaxID=3055860 RepID=UPI0025A210B3|nr:T7SS effector LXG polymorphic toxin [Peribacillus sp. ACCC06369]MDM5358770.1 T7SS effector LXG polymorphic toxin [Peribacillus sp. ACCC06369]